MAATSLRKPRWYLIPVRVLLVTFLITLLSFAVSLFLGILGVLLAAKIKGVHPNLALAYHDVAFPVAGVVAAIVAVSSTVMEVRHYRQSKALNRIEEQMNPAS
jgi:amino acid transporter